MVNTYGSTKCPACGAEHKFYHPKKQLLTLAASNSVQCICGNLYRHTDELIVQDVKNLHAAFNHIITVSKECASMAGKDWFEAQLKLAAAIDECEKMVQP